MDASGGYPGRVDAAMDAGEGGHADKSLAALTWVFETLRADGDKDLLKLGARAVSLFLDVWRDAPEATALREASQNMCEACLGILEAALATHEPLIGPDFLEALALSQYRAELHKSGGSDGAVGASDLCGVVLRSAAAFINADNFLSCTPTEMQDIRPLIASALEPDNFFKVPFHEVIAQYLVVEGARAYCPSLREVLKTSAGMQNVFPIIQEISLKWPGCRGARNLGSAVGGDLRLAAQIARAIYQLDGNSSTSAESSWLLCFAKEVARVVLEDLEPESTENMSLTVMMLLDLGHPAEDEYIAEARKFLASQVIGTGCISSTLTPGLPWHRIRPTWQAARALQPRSEALSGSWRMHFAKRGADLRYAFGHLAGPGSLETRAPAMDLPDWLGVPDSRPGGEAAIVQQSTIGGEKGRGLFAASGCRPTPMELLPDPAHGEGGFLSEEVHERMSEEQTPGHDYIVLVTLGVWFRDEFSPGKLWGTVRPLAAALPRWQREGRCTQEINWSGSDEVYEMGQTDYTRTVFVALDTSECKASMANDALWMACDSDAVYSKKDRVANNLVMVPCARPSPGNPEKVEFSSVWVYPRWGWHWEAGNSQELTLGYGYEEPSAEIAA